MNAADTEAWERYAIALEKSIQLASALFPCQNVFDSLDKLYTVPDLEHAPIQAKAAAQTARAHFLQRWVQQVAERLAV